MATASDVLTPEMIAEGTPNLSNDRRQEMITDAWELVKLIAPCVESVNFNKIGALRAVLRRAIYYDASVNTASKTVQSQTVGPISQSFAVNKPTSVFFTPNQEATIASLCGNPFAETMTSLRFDGPDPMMGRRRHGI